MGARFKQDTGQVEYTAGSAVVAGQLVQLADGRAAVVKTALAAGEKGSAYTEGIFEVDAASGLTLSDGVKVDVDVSEQTAVATTTGDGHLGRLLGAKSSGETTLRVDLNVLP